MGLTHLIGILIGFTYYQRRKRLMTTQVTKTIEVSSIIATVRSHVTNVCRLRSQNCQNATRLEVQAVIK